MSRSDDDFDDRPRRPRRDPDAGDGAAADRPPRPRPDREAGDEFDDRPRRRRREGDADEFDDRPRPRRRDRYDRDDRPAAGGTGLATTGLVLGILSLVTACLAGVPAIICSAVALNRPAGRGRATAGLVLGGIGCFLSLPVMIGLLLPAVQKVRQAAARAAEMNNLKELSLGMHRHEAATGQFPVANGPVSWRVHLLPYIEQGSLHQQFDVSQPWDSPRNRPLAGTRVKTFLSPLDPGETADTHYRVFTGPGTLFPPAGPARTTDVWDGTANTIFAVDAAEAVPWPAPRELPFTRTGPLPDLGHPQRDVVIIAMADGSVRTVRKDRLSPDVLRAAITANGGETLPKDW